jgi:hypothetical protein
MAVSEHKRAHARGGSQQAGVRTMTGKDAHRDDTGPLIDLRLHRWRIDDV